MPASDSLFCFTSNKIDSNFCPNCRAPMLVRVGLDLSARTFECFNCDKVVVIPAERSELSHREPELILDRPAAHPK
jgi:hypothetical protein